MREKIIITIIDENQQKEFCRQTEKALTAGSVKTRSWPSLVDTTRFVLSLFSVMAVMSWLFLSINFCITCNKTN